jgi:hypothetical protein
VSVPPGEYVLKVAKDGFASATQAGLHVLVNQASTQDCKVGNPDRIAAFNFWIFPVLTPWQDNWAGELYALQNPFEYRYIQRGAGTGFQAHGMLSMLPSWVHSETGPIPPPQFSTEDLIAYVKANMEHQAVTTINIGIYQDGSIEQSSLDMMRQLRRAIRGT